MSDENKTPEQTLTGSDPILNETEEKTDSLAAAAEDAAQTAEEAVAEAEEAAEETAEEAVAEAEEAAEETAAEAEETAEEEAAGITSAAAEESAALNDELEQLRSTFQSELDKATADAKAAEDMQPVIQGLDEGPDPDEDEDDESDVAAKTEDEDGKKAKKKKKKKSDAKKPVGLIVALVLICILIVAPLSAYFVLSIKEPNLNSFLSAYAAASSAKDAETKVTKYTEALGFCTEDSKVLAGEKQKLTEKVVLATCESQGYAAAYSYMSSNLDEEAQAKPKTKEFKQFLKIPEQLENIYAAVPEKLPAAIEKAGGADKLDGEALAKEMKTPAPVQKETAENLITLAKAIEGAGNTEDDEQFYSAMHDYLSCYQSIQSMGVNAQQIPEDILVRLWSNGYAYEASLTLDQFFTEETRAAITNEDVNKVITELDALKQANVDADAIARQQVALNKTSDADLTAAIKADISDNAKKAVVRLIKYIVDALKAEEAHNLTAAKRNYSQAISGEDNLNMPVTETALRFASVLLTAGDIDNAYAYVTNYLLDSTGSEDEATAADADTATADTAAASADALLAAHPEFKTDYDEIVALHKAKEAVEEVFSEAYYAAAYGGDSFDTAGVNASLDEIALTNMAKYVSAYVNYYKYVGEIYGDMNKDNMMNYILLAELGFGTHGMICAADKAQIYLSKGDVTNAFTVAKSILAIDAGSDLANSMLSKEQRIAGNAAEAKTYAQAGIDAAGSGSADYCQVEMGIITLIEDNYADAYKQISALYSTQRSNGTLTVDTAELLLAAGSLYKSADKDEQAEIDATVTEVNDLFTQNSLTVSDNTQAIVNGSKKPADVYLGEAVIETLTKAEQ